MPASDLDLLEETAREAGEIASRFWRGDQQVWDKGKEGPVSEADLAVNRHLKERLLNMRPDYGWVSEETEDDPARHSARRVFIIDPIERDAFLHCRGTHLGTFACGGGRRSGRRGLRLSAGSREDLSCSGRRRRNAERRANRGVAARQAGRGFLAELAYRTQPQILVRRTAGRKASLSVVVRVSPGTCGRGQLRCIADASPDMGVGRRGPALSLPRRAGARVSDRNGRSPEFNSGTRQVDGVIAGGHTVHGELLKRLA